jgi:hypothetical protein
LLVSTCRTKQDEINKNFEIKNKIIADANENRERIARGDFCKTCIRLKSPFLGNTTCGLTDEVVGEQNWCKKFIRR